jgi:hypothetical protein
MMRKTPYLLAVAAISGLALMAASSSASPLASALASGSATLPALNEGLVQKVQAWSCQEKRRDMTLQQRRFCDGYYDDYDDYEDYGPGHGYASPEYDYGYPGYGLGVVPFLSFGFNGGRHHHHHGGKWD